ncbi:odorant receptor 30a-like isoform X3 [Prorops nasuta]|uniref:odorant receptor 30a-like isoform X3 n=1 Tax=Prorops nasuta TaxID=863751 RepID=UPI0034CF8D69
MPGFLLLGNCSIGFLTLFPGLQNYRKIFDVICYDWMTEHSEKELEIKESYAKLGMNISTILFVYACTCLMPFIVLDRMFLLKNYVLIHHVLENDTIGSWKYDALYTFHSYVAINVVLYYLVTNYLLFIIQIIHVFGMARVIIYRLQTLSYCNDKISKTKLKGTYHHIHRVIVSCIIKHAHLIELCLLLESYYKPSLFIILIGIIILMSVTLVQAMAFNILSIKTIIIISGEIIFFAGLNYCGQEVTDISYQISINAYNVAWYSYPVYIQKLVILIIQRGQINLIAKSGETFALSLANFGGAVKTAISYCMFLRRVQHL